jgi:hypothetical protein
MILVLMVVTQVDSDLKLYHKANVP